MGGGLNPPFFALIRVIRETHSCPENIARQLRVFGTNPYGAPRFRAVWGWNRLALTIGKWAIRDEHGNWLGEREEARWEPLYSYLNLNRWYLEEWVSAGTFFGSPEDWCRKAKEGTPQPGQAAFQPTMPYNPRGEYDHRGTIEDDAGNFVQLTSTLVDQIIHELHRQRSFSAGERRALENRKVDKHDRDYDSFADSVLNDENKFEGKPHIYVPEGVL